MTKLSQILLYLHSGRYKSSKTSSVHLKMRHLEDFCRKKTMKDDLRIDGFLCNAITEVQVQLGGRKQHTARFAWQRSSSSTEITNW